MMNNKMKYIDIVYHFIKNELYYELIELVKLEDNFNPTNAFIKVIGDIIIKNFVHRHKNLSSISKIN